MFVGEIIYKDGNYFFKSNLRCQIKSPITLDRCAGHANVNRRFHTSTFSLFFCMDELSISSTLWDHLRSCAKIM